MADVYCVNASPLIFLARVHQLELLTNLANRILVPAAVIREIEAGGARDRALARVTRMDAIEQVFDVEIPEKIRAWDLGAGESQVLAKSLDETGSEVVLDDLAARRCAKSLALPMIGTLGIVLLNRQNGFLDRARPLVEELRAKGLRLSDSLMESALEKVGE